MRVVEVRAADHRANVVLLRTQRGWLVADPVYPHGTRAMLERGDLGAPIDAALVVGRVSGGSPPPVRTIHTRNTDVGAADTIAFEHELLLRDARSTIVIRALGPGATDSDVLVWLPAERTAFAGAILQLASVTATDATDATGWQRALDSIDALAPERIVPLSGTVATPDACDALRTVLDATLDAVRERHAREPDPAPFPERATTSLIRAMTRAVTLGGHGPLGDLRGARVATPQAPGPRTLLTGPLSHALRARIREVAPDLTLIEANDTATALAAAPRVDACVARFVSEEFLAAAPRLVWIQAPSAGVENLLDLRALREREALVLTNMRATSGDPIADHAFGMMLQLTRNLGGHREAQLAGRWERDPSARHSELHGRTLLVVGLGGIGQAVAVRGRAFGMTVFATDVRTTPKPEFVDRIGSPEELDTLLPLADVVVVCVPLTSDTRGLFSAERFDRMRRGALFVNVARGRIVDTEALLAALESGRIGGVGLDVVDPEPLPEGHPLWGRGDVVITPHVAGRSPETEARRDAVFVENVGRFVRGEVLLNTVDKQAGF